MNQKQSSAQIESATAFLSVIFEPDDERLSAGHIGLFNVASKETYLARSPDDAARQAGEPAWADVTFFGCCTRDVRAMRERAAVDGKEVKYLRGCRDEMIGMPGLWVDVDVVGPGHKDDGPGLCPSISEALAVVERAIPLKPTVTVRTGGGIHCYWLFAEGVVEFTDDGTDRSRREMEDRCRRFNAMVRDELKSRGWGADMVGDLPRSMRLPGFSNMKTGHPRPTRWEETGPRYDIDALDAVVPEGLQLTINDGGVSGELDGGTHVDSSDPRLTMVMGELDEYDLDEAADMLCEAHHGFAKIWRKPARDQNAADMSMADILLIARVETQLTVDLLRLHRLRGLAGDASKAQRDKVNRTGYYLLTIRKALGMADDHHAKEAEQEVLAETSTRLVKLKDVIETSKSGTVDVEVEVIEEAFREVDDARVTVLAMVNASLGLGPEKALVRIVRDSSGQAATERWKIHFAMGKAKIVTTAALRRDYHAMADAVYSSSGHCVEPYSAKQTSNRQWTPIAVAVFAASEESGEGDEPHQAAKSMVRFIAADVRSGRNKLPAAGTEAWHASVAGDRESVHLFEPGSKNAKCTRGLLVSKAAAVAHFLVDPEFEVPGSEHKKMLRAVAGALPGVTPGYYLNYKDAGGKWRSRSTHVLLEESFFAALSADAVSIYRAARESATDEDAS